jgi:hypothetical protein
VAALSRAEAFAGGPLCGPGAPEPSEDGRAEAAALLGAGAFARGAGRAGGAGRTQEPAAEADVLEAAAAAGRVRTAAALMDLVLLGGPVTARFAHLADPHDAPLLDGLALLRAVGAIPAIAARGRRTSG